MQKIISIGIIGYGSMGSAIANAIINSEMLKNIFSLSVYSRDKTTGLNSAMNFTNSMSDFVKDSDIILIAVRPEQVEEVVLNVVKNYKIECTNKILMSVAAGITLDFLQNLAGNKFSIVRVMPNTLVEVGKAVFGLCTQKNITISQKDIILSLLNGIGTVVELDERDMNAFTALAGCAPGFLFHIMDSLSEAGVSVGLSREISLTISRSLMTGCGILAETTHRHPSILREKNTSPAGMTIAGLNYLDTNGFRGHLIEAVKIAYNQGKSMEQNISNHS